MQIRYIPADPAGNLTAFVLTPVPAAHRAALAARLMARCPEGFEQVGFVSEDSLMGSLPRLDMMGGEFCGNASRAFALLAAQRRGRGEQALDIAVSGARAPVHVELSGVCAYADMPLPLGVQQVQVLGREIPLVCMEGICHALLMGLSPSPESARAVLAVMPAQDAQGVLFVRETQMTPFVFVGATGTGVWESSCGSGSVALGWYLARKRQDGAHAFAFAEPGGQLQVRVFMQGGMARRVVMGGAVRLSSERSIDIKD